MRPRRWIVATAAGLAFLAGCADLAGRGRETSTGAASLPDGGTRVAEHLEALERLAGGSAAEQAALVEAARIDFVAVPTTGNRLRYALVLAMPGHAGFDPSGAHELLQKLLSEPEGLSGPERALADIVDRELQAQRALQERLNESEAAASRSRDQLAAAGQRNESLSEENLRLQQELDQARRKLEAIAELEKALSTRQVAPEGGT